MKTPNYSFSKSNAFYGLGVFLLLLTSLSCNQTEKTPNEEANLAEDHIELSEIQFEAVQLQTGGFMEDIFNESVHSNGYFEVPPENKVVISSYFGGRVKELKLLPGNKVTKNQDLFTLENPEFIKLQEEYLSAKGQIKNLKAEFDRQADLLKEHFSSEKSFLKSELDFQQTVLRMESIGKQLLLMNIDPDQLTPSNMRSTIAVKAPISGYVSSIKTVKGSNLAASQEAMTIVNADELHLELFIFEKDIEHVKEGQTIDFFLQNDPQTTYQAEVHLINKSIDKELRTINVHADIYKDSIQSHFFPGLYVEAFIQTKTIRSMALPKEAIAELDGNNFVLKLMEHDNGKYTFEKSEVILGESNTKNVQILNAEQFDSQSQFLLKGTFQLIAE
jgi:membrane fusion protein, heavy metal efflux system